MRRPNRLGVVGAGTMGAGIAQIGVLGGIQTVLYDPVAGALDRATERVATDLLAGTQRGRWDAATASAATDLLATSDGLDGLSGCDLIIEAAPESLEVKRGVFADLQELFGASPVLATNTSSLLVSAVAAELEHPETVVGMHFFNPVPRMRLVEVVPGRHTAPETVSMAASAARAMGRTVIEARDGPGFVVNRVGRPFYGESLRLAQERIASFEQIDRICRLGGGFRMGPFELMDLVGIDVGFAVFQSFHAASFGEPRWRPSPLQANLVATGALGRKTGAGWYVYGDQPHRPPDPSPPAAGGFGPPVSIQGEGREARALLELARAQGIELNATSPAVIVVDQAPRGSDREIRGRNGQAVLLLPCTSRSLGSWRTRGAFGYSLLPMPGRQLIELVRPPGADDHAAAMVQRLMERLGLLVEWVDDGPGLVLARIVCQIVNEACFAVGEGVATPEDIDLGARLGLNYPTGPITWGEQLGWSFVLAVIDGLWTERREERFRPAPFLQRMAWDAGLEHA